MAVLAFAAVARADDDDNAVPSTQSTAEPAADKSAYNLFHPTPVALMRDLNPNRPDVTEGPYTVDAGHLQIESSFAEYTRDRANGATFTQWSVLPTNFRVGLLNNTELDVLLQPYLWQQIRSTPFDDIGSGFGDSQIRLVQNLWGNDGGKTALGIIGFVSLPTARRELGTGFLQYGVIVPFAIELPLGFGLTTMAEFDFNRNDANTGYGVDYVHSASLDHKLLDKLDGYIEYVGHAPANLGETYQAFVDTGLIYALTDNLAIDCGVNIGISKHSTDVLAITGFTLRI
jgi:hypothetical protein